MSYNYSSGNFSSRSACLRYPGSSCGSSYPSNLVYSTDLCSANTCQLGSSLNRGCQESFCEPRSYHTSCVVSNPCQTSCYPSRISTLCSPCQTTYTGSVGFGTSSGCSLGYESRSCYSQSSGFSGFRPLSYGAHGFSSLGYGSGLCRPYSWASRSCQSCYRPTCGSGFY
ncbi:PREDICTED: keratin-associated protein 13-1-like [Elephantulus edwardii]|uniref:keratin-associated protein 13-1-like n=1 Tax=Elephantulus edwardii TaxID=28737 RepID=UPI0003F09503|nr:PREDICTED: keratin-associated protein 13-1-like [Elephantulus edwardii]